jgi:hypothetical protein
MMFSPLYLVDQVLSVEPSFDERRTNGVAGTLFIFGFELSSFIPDFPLEKNHVIPAKAHCCPE